MAPWQEWLQVKFPRLYMGFLSESMLTFFTRGLRGSFWDLYLQESLYMEVYCGQKSIYCNRTDFRLCYQVFANNLASLSSFCNHVFAIKFLQSSFCKLSFFAIEFLQLSACNRVCFFLQSSFCSWFRIIIKHHFLFLPHPYSIQVPVPTHEKQSEKMAAAGPTELQLELSQHPHGGRCSYEGYLHSLGFHISLWHIDGYHKLIRWRIVIHRNIDVWIFMYPNFL